jgi:hypothetical protein
VKFLENQSVIMLSIAPLLRSSTLEPIPTLSRACACLVRSCTLARLYWYTTVQWYARSHLSCDRAHLQRLLHFCCLRSIAPTFALVHLCWLHQQTWGSCVLLYKFIVLASARIICNIIVLQVQGRTHRELYFLKQI